MTPIDCIEMSIQVCYIYKLKHMCVKPNFFAAENQRATKKTLIVGEREEMR